MVSIKINILVRVIFSLIRAHMKYGALVLFLSVAMQLFSDTIIVGGKLEESETWISGNTYIVNQDLIIPSDVILTIQAGVAVRVNFGRGIVVENGTLKVLGNQIDSVCFIPNHSNPGEFWEWKGLSIKNSDPENINFISYACFVDAETAIKLENCENVVIENSSILNCQNLGVQITNSMSCLLDNCKIEDNYNGVEIYADNLGEASNNTISNCSIKNQNHNVKLLGEGGGVVNNNLISGNLIEEGNSGIWIINKDDIGTSINIIERNIIINNGSVFGYGLFLALNSTIVRNNIFWRNNIAIFNEDIGDDCILSNNSFYENKLAININGGSEGNSYLNSTFSLNSNEVLDVGETQGIVFSANNLMHNIGNENIVINNTEFDLSIINNYWGTIETSQIDNLIYDNSDDPDVGVLSYVPFLNIADTSNPVSPPFQVIKQQAGNKVRISWQPNQEQDLMGYRIYSGIYSKYSFTDKNEIGTNTSFTLSGGVSVFDPFAVTAFDSTEISIDAQLSGHESPFAFAVLHPYASNDTVICNNLNSFEIVNSNIPFEYQSVFWTSSGDGIFNNPYLNSPTYFPGPLDFLSGGTVLSFTVTTSDNEYFDSFSLSIIDDPVVFAGGDTTVIADVEIFLDQASAENFDTIRWLSSGDGSFNFDTLVNPIYYPGISDIESGVVYLEMIVYSICGSVSDTVKIVIEPYFSVEGKLWTYNKSTNPGVVIAFRENDEGSRAMQIVNTESNGSFRFERLMTGNYYLYAIPDTNNLDNVVPGYYANKLRWQSAYLLTVEADVYDADIYLPSIDFLLPIGEASISGHMLKPQASKFSSDIYCMPWFENNSNEFCNNGLSNVTVLLFNHDKSKLLDFTLTDDVGDFYFKHLPFGSYVVDAEKAGFVTTASSVINLNVENDSESGVILEINQQKIGITFGEDAPTELNSSIFPNPATTEINIPFVNPLLLTSQIEVHNLFGNRVINYVIPSKQGEYVHKLDISSLSSGLYLGRIVNSNKTIHFRFVKK